MNEGRFPNKEWFWSICYTVIPEWTSAYKKQVLENRSRKKGHDFNKKKVISISDKWREKLKEFDYDSKRTLQFLKQYKIILNNSW